MNATSIDTATRIGFLGLAYGLGVGLSPYPVFTALLALAGLGLAWGLNRWRRGRWPLAWSLAMVVVVLVGSWYGQWRMPQPLPGDISNFVQTVESKGSPQFATLRGRVESHPKITRNHRAQFWLAAQQLSQIQGNSPEPATMRRVSGQLYVTAPLLSATGLKPGVEVVATGNLYKPGPVLNPGGMDFAAYLARSGTFAGLRSVQLMLPDEDQTRRWDATEIRQRIVQTHVRGLDVPAGPLVAAMALGSDAVDLPFEVQDNFVRVGLAHALAASGFQVSLVVGGLIALTRRWSAKWWQLGFTLAGIGVFVLLAGAQPAVLRAALMGVAVAIGLLIDRQVRPLPALVTVATLMLAWNPLWLWDVGFQLSFLATWGLAVSAKPIQNRLNFLPPLLAEALAVPLAAALWTLPLQLWHFKVLPLYALPANVVTSPLVTLLSVGGMVTAALGLIWMPLGAWLSGWLALPCHLLLGLVHWFAHWPGAHMAVGQIAPWQLGWLYGSIAWVWLHRTGQRRWPWVGAIALGVVILPLWVTQLQTFQITALATGSDRVLTIQRHYQTAVIDAGDSDTARFTLLPFLVGEGVNQIDRAWALADGYQARKGWETLAETVKIERIGAASGGQKIAGLEPESWRVGEVKSWGSGKIKLLAAQPSLVEFDIDRQRWLVGDNLPPDRQRELATGKSLEQVVALYWPGGMLTEKFMDAIQPQVAIASSNNPDPDTIQKLEKLGTKVFVTGRDGAIQWRSDRGFAPLLENN